MKQAVRLLVIIFMVVAIASPSRAQGQRNKDKFEWGAEAGLNLSSATGSWTDHEGYTREIDSGIVAGVFGVYNVTNHFAVRSELLFGRKGFVLKGEDNLVAEKLSPYGYYMDVPVLLEWDFLPHRYVRPHVFAGPSFGYLLREGIGVKLDGQKRSNQFELTNFKDTNFSFMAGVRLSFPAGRRDNRGYFEIRYNHSLDSFLSDTDVRTLYINEDRDKITIGGSGSPDAAHQVLMIIFGITL